ncbi:MAG TPA: radical SAM protein [Candidatus Latescibacteria bacterium]|nr:radical SAM protein [Candidatus Latescibacterota bacterium]
MINLTALLSEEPSKTDGIRYSRESHPMVLVWNVTPKCNLRCLHCYSASSSDGELPHEEALRALAEFKEAGVKTILFSGGEPLLREDILDLGRFASSLNISPALSTNGTLITEEIAREIKRSGFSYVGVSLDGLERTNDWVRGRKGAFGEAIRGMENALSEGIRVGVRFTITKFNAGELFQLIDLAESIGIKRFCIYHLVYSGRARPEHDLKREEKRNLIEKLIRKAKGMIERGSEMQILTVTAPFDGVFLYLLLRREVPEKAEKALQHLKIQGGESSGSKLLRVDQSGWVYPNQFWERRLGNIRERSFSEIISTDPLLTALRDRPRRLSGRCGICLFKEICGGFRARADQLFKDPFGEDPACYLSIEEIKGEV